MVTDEMVDAHAAALCKSGRFETGQGTCAPVCMDQLGSPRKSGCPHTVKVHGKLSRTALEAAMAVRNAVVSTDDMVKAAWAAFDKAAWVSDTRAEVLAAKDAEIARWGEICGERDAQIARMAETQRLAYERMSAMTEEIARLNEENQASMTEIAALRRDLERLGKALKPFAGIAAEKQYTQKRGKLYAPVTLDSCRRARAALEGEG